MYNGKMTEKKLGHEWTVLASQKGKSSIYLKLGIVAAVLFVMITIINQEMEISQKQRQLHSIQEQMRVQEMINDEMEWMVQNCDNQANYERIARAELGLVKPDERVFMFVTEGEE